MSDALRIGTRGSRLALYQANYVKDLLRERLGLATELVILKTQGDKDQSRPVTELGGVGVFVKELERALLAEEVDLAVHSLKDLPTEMPDGLEVIAYPIRVHANEVLIINRAAHAPGKGPIPLRAGATVGTASLRRKAQLLELRPDLRIAGIRGNVPTRVEKALGEVDAVMLAAAGIDRLEIELPGDLVRADLDLDEVIPAPGQAALAIQVRAGDPRVERLAELDDAAARTTTEAERHLLHELGAGCSVPLGAYATREADDLVLRAIYEVGQTAQGAPLLRRARVRGRAPEGVAHLALRVLDPPPAGEGVSLQGKTVLVARDPDRAADLVDAVIRAGGTGRSWSPTTRRSLQGDASLDVALENLSADGWVVFASVNAVRQAAIALGDELGPLGRYRIGAVGPGTARALAQLGVAVDVLPERSSGAGMAAALLAHLGDERPPVVLPAARGGRTELSDGLSAAGCEVTVVELYTSEPNDAPPPEILAGIDALVLASPSGARAALAGDVPQSCRIVAFGSSTKEQVETLGRKVAAVAAQPTVKGVLAALAAALGS